MTVSKERNARCAGVGDLVLIHLLESGWLSAGKCLCIHWIFLLLKLLVF